MWALGSPLFRFFLLLWVALAAPVPENALQVVTTANLALSLHPRAPRYVIFSVLVQESSFFGKKANCWHLLGKRRALHSQIQPWTG
jgi:hypothetical protein